MNNLKEQLNSKISYRNKDLNGKRLPNNQIYMTKTIIMNLNKLMMNKLQFQTIQKKQKMKFLNYKNKFVKVQNNKKNRHNINFKKKFMIKN